MNSFLEVKLRRLQKKTYEDKYDIRDKNLHTVLARQVCFAGCRLKQLVYLIQSRINPNIEANRKQPKLI